MTDIDYVATRTRCAQSFDKACMDYFLALPRADLYSGEQNRENVASGYCSEEPPVGTRARELPCDVLCRDNRSTCLDQRRRYCATATLEDVENGTRSDCACYLPPEQYRRHIERLRVSLGDEVADQLLSSLNTPHCFYSPCARSVAGLATRSGGCQSVAGCLQSVTLPGDVDAIVTNVCIIDKVEPTPEPTPTPTPGEPSTTPSVPSSTWAFSSTLIWVIIVILILLVIGVALILLVPRRNMSKDTYLQSIYRYRT